MKISGKINSTRENPMEQFSQNHMLSPELILLICIFIILSHKQLISSVFLKAGIPSIQWLLIQFCLSLARDHSFPKLCWAFYPWLCKYDEQQTYPWHQTMFIHVTIWPKLLEGWNTVLMSPRSQAGSLSRLICPALSFYPTDTHIEVITHTVTST